MFPRGRALRAVEAAAEAQAAQASTSGGAGASTTRGDLTFTATFEGGNLGSVNRVSELEYELALRPDSNNPKYRLWYASHRATDGPLVSKAHMAATEPLKPRVSAP
jgi:hypothetical protein